jgi:HEAT repeat protein
LRNTLAAAFVLAAIPLAAQTDVAKDVSELLVTLKGGKPEERAASARILGEIGPTAKDAVAGLSEALADSERDVRQQAARALGQIGPPAKPAVGDLIKSLGDKEWQVRQSAAYALGRIGDPAAKASLNAAKKDKNENVKQAAKDALKALKKRS